MVSRIFTKEIKDWWNNKVHKFIVEQVIQRGQPITKVSKEMLYVEGASDQYENFWCKFLEELYNWLRKLKVHN